MKNTQRWLGLGALALALPFAAAAQEAYTRGSPTLFAGPSTNYPAVARLGSGQPLEIVGCTSGYGWCDVVLPDGLRGWVPANRLDYDYGGDTLPLASYGAAIGVPIIGFSLGNYWGNYYRDRPWYGEQRWWGNRPPPPVQPGWRAPPPPAVGWAPRPVAPGWNGQPQHPGWNGQPQPQRPGWNGQPPQQRPEWNGRPPVQAAPPVAMPRPQPAQPQFPMQRPQPGPQPQVHAPGFPPGGRGATTYNGNNPDRP